MAIELHHLNTHGMMEQACDVLDGVVRLKERIAELEKENAELKEAQRWRKFSEEMPEHDAWCLVFHEGEIDVDHYTDDCNSQDRFIMYGFYVTHWMPLPSAPKEEKK